MDATPSHSGRPLRFPRSFRLKSPLAIRGILRDDASKRRRWDAFSLVWSKTAESTDGRPSFAFVVSRSAGPAVVRNRIKRRLREAVRLNRAHWPDSGTQIVIRPRGDNAAKTDFQELNAQMREALETVAGLSR